MAELFYRFKKYSVSNNSFNGTWGTRTFTPFNPILYKANESYIDELKKNPDILTFSSKEESEAYLLVEEQEYKDRKYNQDKKLHKDLTRGLSQNFLEFFKITLDDFISNEENVKGLLYSLPKDRKRYAHLIVYKPKERTGDIIFGPRSSLSSSNSNDIRFFDIEELEDYLGCYTNLPRVTVFDCEEDKAVTFRIKRIELIKET